MPIDATILTNFVERLLGAYNVPSEHAAILAHSLVLADLRGVDTHGTARIPSYLARVRAGVLDPISEMVFDQKTPVVYFVDAKNGFGAVAASLAMKTCIEMASVYGIGMASVAHSNHFGMSAAYALQAAESGMMSLVFTNSSPALPPWGGMGKLLGVSPICCGAPGGPNGGPFVLDMAPSIAARGKIYKAKRRNESIPPDWALDSNGKPTTDPSAALDGGVMLPMGGPKGSALSIMMDVFSGVLSGSAFAGLVTNPYDPSKPADVGHFIVAIKPDLFISIDEFKERMDYLYKRVVSSPRAADIDRIYFPGELEMIEHERRKANGIPLVEAEINALNEEADLVGIERITYT